MTAREWLAANPEAAHWAKTTYEQFPGRQKHGVWQAVWQGLKERGCPCSLNAIRIALTDRDGVEAHSKNSLHLPGKGGDSAPLSGAEAPQDSEHSSERPALHVKKLHVHVPNAVTPASSNGMLTAVLYGDTHLPFQDDAALRVVAQVIRVVKPDVVVHMGDLMDAYHLSRFDKNPKRIHTLQDEIDMARAHLASFRILAPKARFVFLEGNHSDRLRRALWSMPPQAEALMKLDAITNNLTWPKLLGLEELGIEFIPYGEQSRANIFPRFIVKHGTVVRQLSAYTARAEWQKYGRSGASGHTHRLGMFMHRDHNGNHVWVETGCTCKLDPEYAVDPDWAQGCVVVTFEQKTGAFQVEPVYIHHGTTVFRGQWYDTKED